MNENNFDQQLTDEATRDELEQRIALALEEARRGWEHETELRVSAARVEGERIAGMTAEERMIERERQLEQREREVTCRELRALAMQMLISRGLPGELAEALSFENREDCERSIDNVERAFRSAVQAGVTQRLGASTPPAGAEPGDPAKLTDDQYYAAKMANRRRW